MSACQDADSVLSQEPNRAAAQPGAISPDRLPEAPSSPKAESAPQGGMLKGVEVSGQLAKQAGNATPQLEVREVRDLPTADPEKELSVSRLVVTSAIEKREPVTTASFTAGSESVYAFIELGNTGKEERDIVVTFEHESGRKVGFVELKVPAKQTRWRTWGRTGQIKTPGKWTAVIRVKDGAELSRESFEVSEPGVVASGS
jgi:hypothetical protein